MVSLYRPAILPPNMPVQFDVILPAMHALGLPFPLGGTSNHFKASVLKSIGRGMPIMSQKTPILGLRLAQYGFRERPIDRPDVLKAADDHPCLDSAAHRWIKGYMQTVLVPARLNRR